MSKNIESGELAEYIQPKIEVIPGNLIRGGTNARVDFNDEPNTDPTGYATS